MKSKTKRWIILPLWMMLTPVILIALNNNSSPSLNEFLFFLIIEAIDGFTIAGFSDARTRAITGRTDDEIYETNQQRNLTLLLNYEKSFEMCLEAAESINPAKIKKADAEKGIVELRTRFRWDSFGDIIKLKLTRINENLTEVDISTRPIPRTVLVSNGYAWKFVEDISTYLREKDAEINKNLLIDSAAILDDVYVNPFQKEKIYR